LALTAASSPSLAAPYYEFSFTAAAANASINGYFDILASYFSGSPTTLQSQDVFALSFNATYPGGTESWTSATSGNPLSVSYLGGVPHVDSTYSVPGIAVNAGGFSMDLNCCGAIDFYYPGGGYQIGATETVTYFAAAPTPLPSTWLMLLSGFLGLGFFAYRGSKKNALATA
jgi:hypothetical protein